MRRFVYMALPLVGLLTLFLSGCHHEDAPPPPAPGTTPAGGKGAAASNSQLGLNPNFNGPANGGLGAKGGGQ